ncbi:hypothetical protein XFF6991_540005 [Xanthomonas phaseoli pv. phaseoli]|uniref:Uncharacterized protein n=1 Tax=Xanthomonas campestris pv. phaseoli TaxID=317013 RepID=A0A7Z7NIW4_XANCH|nr:hypothetical protein XFF6991_540005 [Xanthomonas phaseoli pv. phaseoli]
MDKRSILQQKRILSIIYQVLIFKSIIDVSVDSTLAVCPSDNARTTDYGTINLENRPEN